MINLIELMQNMIDLTHYGTIHTHTHTHTQYNGIHAQHCTVHDGKGNLEKVIKNL